MIKASFFEYNVAVSGLFTAQNNLQVSSHNIANAQTKGYSRQYAQQRATRPVSYGDGRGMYGTGSEVYGIGQIRDLHLDAKYRKQIGNLGEYSSKASQLELIERSFNDLNGTGLNSSITDLFNQLQEVGTTPGDLTVRNNFLTKGKNLTELVATIGKTLENQQKEVNEEVKITVDRMNSIGKQITSLNKQIKRYELTGDKANDLRDQRAILVDELSEYVNVTVVEVEKNKNFNPQKIETGLSKKEFSVKINGYTFVQGEDFNGLETKPREVADKKNPSEVEGMYDVVFEGSGQKFNMYSRTLKGTLKGLIDVRDGNNNRDKLYSGGINSYDESFEETTSYKGIPHYMDKLNEFIRVLSRSFNEGVDYEGEKLKGVIGHIDGFDRNGEDGNTLFTYLENGVAINKVTSYSDVDYSKMNFKNFSMNTDMLRDPNLLAAAKDNNSDESDGTVILGFLGMQKDKSLFAEGSVEDYTNGILVELGISVQQSENFENLYTDNTKLTENQKLAISGVDVNEEMMLMMQYQQQYQASAKLINVIDSIYDTLINSIGR